MGSKREDLPEDILDDDPLEIDDGLDPETEEEDDLLNDLLEGDDQ